MLPRLEGRQVQVAEWLEPEPIVGLFLQPGRYFPFAVKVIFEDWLTFAVTTTALLYVAVVAEAAKANELKVGAVYAIGRFAEATFRLYLVFR